MAIQSKIVCTSKGNRGSLMLQQTVAKVTNRDINYGRRLGELFSLVTQVRSYTLVDAPTKYNILVIH